MVVDEPIARAYGAAAPPLASLNTDGRDAPNVLRVLQHGPIAAESTHESRAQNTPSSPLLWIFPERISNGLEGKGETRIRCKGESER